MIVDAENASSTDPAAPIDPDAPAISAPGLQVFVFALFFIWGGITSLNDVIIPKLKDLFSLSYFQAMLVQFAFFTAYLVVSPPAAIIVKRLGYMRTAAVGLLVMVTGCLLFAPASAIGAFYGYLVALFVLAGGITVVQVVANPLIAMLGSPRTAHSRLTFAQAFNSLGTTLFPRVGSSLILGSISALSAATLSGAALVAYRRADAHMVVVTYLVIAAALAIVATAVWLQRNKLNETPSESGAALGGFDLLKRLRFGWGALCIFVYVGAEVAIGSLIVNYLEQHDVMGLSQQAAGNHVWIYWFGAMVGRFIGAFVLRVISPGKVLAGVAVAAIALILVSANTAGVTAAYALLAIGLFNSIMFPTIFTLASEGLGARTADGSGILCMSIFGGAIIPPFTGWLADQTHNLRASLAVPAICYLIILAYGVYARRSAAASGRLVSAH